MLLAVLSYLPGVGRWSVVLAHEGERRHILGGGSVRLSLAQSKAVGAPITFRFIFFVSFEIQSDRLYHVVFPPEVHSNVR